MKANAPKRKIFDAADVLVGDSPTLVTAKVDGGVQMIPVEQIRPFHDHPFRMYEGELLQDMVESVRSHGVLNPVIVLKQKDGYEMLAGHNRMNAAKKLKRALSDTEKILEEYAKLEEEDEATRKDDEDKLLDELAAQGMHENLSFFAFTATPKGKTLQMFGNKDAEGKYHPFHIYSMRQAIEEHFILDVLKYYMTYKMYYNIVKTIPDNPELDTLAGIRAIQNYESLHPHNIASKTTIMLEHFRTVTQHKIGGKAKAMVVTPSRLHAVRYLQEFKRQIEEKGYNLDVLVAFSGEVEDGDQNFTEEKMNRTRGGETIKEKALPEAFHTDDYGMLIVAEKYQTGFDEPSYHVCR